MTDTRLVGLVLGIEIVFAVFFICFFLQCILEELRK
jgi:hypothetical protein